MADEPRGPRGPDDARDLRDPSRGDERDEPLAGDSPTFIRITNAMVWAEIQSMRAEIRQYAQQTSDYAETKRRIRSLELKSYGIMAGLVGALVVLLKLGGVPV